MAGAYSAIQVDKNTNIYSELTLEQTSSPSGIGANSTIGTPASGTVITVLPEVKDDASTWKLNIDKKGDE